MNSFSHYPPTFPGQSKSVLEVVKMKVLFNTFLKDLFLFISNCSLSNYEDDNTLYTFGDKLKKIQDNLRSSFDTVHQWFYENYMVLNAGKCNFMCLGNITETETFLFRTQSAFLQYSPSRHLPAQIQQQKHQNKVGICSKLTIKTTERHHSRHSRRSGVFIVISHLVLVFLLLTLRRQCRLANILMENSEEQKILALIIDNKFNFKSRK